MDIQLSNKARELLGLRPIDPLWDIHKEGNNIFYYKDFILHKAIQYTDKNEDSLYIEYDTSITLNEQFQMISTRGKAKDLNFGNIEKESKKEVRLTINISKKSILAECGIKWLPELSCRSIETLEKDMLIQIREQYGESLWEKKVKEFLKSPKLRQTYKDGDVFCIRLDANKYVYAVLIASFMKLRKMDVWPSRGSGHLFTQLMTVPIILRKYNFISSRNDLTVEEVIQHELLNPDTIMDDALLRGEYKIIGKKKLVEDDISLPMHYSCYGRRDKGGLTSAWGIGIFDKENRGLEKEWLESRLPYYNCINIIFTWGFGFVELDLKEFLKSKNSDIDFCDAAGIGGLYGSLDDDGNLVNPGSIFEPEKVKQIFDTMGVNLPNDFDAFNKKYGGLTRHEYIEKIG